MHYIKRHDAVDLCGGEVCHSRDVEILESKLTEAEQENKRLRDALEFFNELVEYIEGWSTAYPLDVFPEPDMKKARKLLEVDGGIKIDVISAHNMRHVLNRMMEFLDKPEGKRARDVLRGT